MRTITLGYSISPDPKWYTPISHSNLTAYTYNNNSSSDAMVSIIMYNKYIIRLWFRQTDRLTDKNRYIRRRRSFVIHKKYLDLLLVVLAHTQKTPEFANIVSITKSIIPNYSLLLITRFALQIEFYAIDAISIYTNGIYTNRKDGKNTRSNRNNIFFF